MLINLIHPELRPQSDGDVSKPKTRGKHNSTAVGSKTSSTKRQNSSLSWSTRSRDITWSNVFAVVHVQSRKVVFWKLYMANYCEVAKFVDCMYTVNYHNTDVYITYIPSYLCVYLQYLFNVSMYSEHQVLVQVPGICTAVKPSWNTLRHLDRQSPLQSHVFPTK